MQCQRRGLLTAAFLVAAFPALAQQNDASHYPSQTITLIVPYAAGGPPDVASRILGPALTDILGKQVIIENRAGASTALGTQALIRAEPDGHTLMMADISLTVAPNIVATSGYDPRRDVAPVAPILRTFMGLVVHPSVPANSVAELVALAKAKPGDLKYGTSGPGSPPDLGAIVFRLATGADMVAVPYRGVALALNDMVAGHLSLVFVSQATAQGQVQAGKAKVLAVFGEKRVPSMPNVPTFGEVGLDTKVLDTGVWFGVVAPAKTPPAIIAKLNAAINQALKEPATKQRLEAADFNLTGGTPQDLGKIINEHTDYWRAAFVRAGVKPE
ncbi:tripartite tricarboxylate transporter substrate binding protein [Roseiarcaceae bacterium H3SJ34-1]|uniref:Bug family tripartite tricarboxylate transporter substrate binding protein n=1 Tax=Terripilifer ovatus TaxID=3032367 RepID=UPI003AB941D5|nr:tripartite tricarboxylate transporter substrate binding protein [Roseiarcaceae bacterium H3SJ34-1]